MAAIARPGIHAQWQGAWPSTVKDRDRWFGNGWPRETEQLRHYVEHGQRKPSPHVPQATLDPVVPPRASWEEANVAGTLRLVASLQHWKWERAAVEEGRLDAVAFASLFTAARIAELAALHVHVLFPQRNRGRVLARMDPMGFCYAALGIVFGDAAEALSLAGLLVKAVHRGFYEHGSFRPTSAFIARLLADHLGRPVEGLRGDRPPLQKGELAADPVFASLLSVWRDPDPELLAPACLAACDAHTYLSAPGPSHRREFIGTWSRTPVAVRLVFQLRALHGLVNPRLQHPLLDSVLGTSPASSATAPPEAILIALVARMKRDGFTEAPE